MQLNTRMNGHAYSIRHPNKACCPFLAQHFNNGKCKDFTVQIIEKVDDTLTKTEQRAKRQEIEEYYIRLLKTKFPYGLNDKLHAEQDELTIHQNLKIPRSRHKKRGRRKPRSKRTKSINYSIYDDLKENEVNDTRKSRKIAYTSIMTANKNTYKNLCVQLDIMEDDNFNSYLKDLCETKIHRPRETHIKAREKRNFLKLNFVNHHMNNLRL